MKTFLFATASALLAATASAACLQAGAHRPTPIKSVGTHAPATADIVDTALGAGQFTALVAAVQAAGLVDALKGPGPFTVFAPSDAAFAKLPPAELAKLLAPEGRAALTKILTYHVVPGVVLSSDLAGRKTHPRSLEGATLRVDATGTGLKVDAARVVAADIAASNGVIHVIDTVLMPPG